MIFITKYYINCNFLLKMMKATLLVVLLALCFSYSSAQLLTLTLVVPLALLTSLVTTAVTLVIGLVVNGVIPIVEGLLAPTDAILGSLTTQLLSTVTSLLSTLLSIVLGLVGVVFATVSGAVVTIATLVDTVLDQTLIEVQAAIFANVTVALGPLTAAVSVTDIVNAVVSVLDLLTA